MHLCPHCPHKGMQLTPGGSEKRGLCAGAGACNRRWRTRGRTRSTQTACAGVTCCITARSTALTEEKDDEGGVWGVPLRGGEHEKKKES